MSHIDDEDIPEWLQKCLKCKHVLIKQRDAVTVYCRRSKKGCKFEEYKPKIKRGQR